MTSNLDKENATADIGATQSFGNGAKPTGKDKKSRSKSLGPGGLDALQNSNGNRRKVCTLVITSLGTFLRALIKQHNDSNKLQSTASFPLKSILKPTVPVSPVRNIPSFEETRRRSASRDETRQSADHADEDDQSKEGLLIDFATPPQPSIAGTEKLDNPFDTFNATSAIRDEMAATRERDEKERRERERQSILEKREARRKSMGLSPASAEV